MPSCYIFGPYVNSLLIPWVYIAHASGAHGVVKIAHQYGLGRKKQMK